MSHSVTITTTRTSSGSTLVCNTDYLKTVPGLLKLFQLLIGIACTGTVCYYYERYHLLEGKPDLFFLLMVVTFMIATFCLLVSCLISLSTGGIISKTIYELIYHSIATILLLAASLALIIEVSRFSSRYYQSMYDAYMAASIMGLVNAVLYCISAIYAQRSYRGI